jgi:hypothetical protein
MLVRQEALQSAGLLDERTFIYSEEPDLCRRIRLNGWDLRHLPLMTIIHHAGKAGIRPKLLAQDVYSRLLYCRKHMTRSHRVLFRLALGLKYLLRVAIAAVHPGSTEARRANAAALRVVLGLSVAPFEAPPPTALRPFVKRSCRPGGEKAVLMRPSSAP